MSIYSPPYALVQVSVNGAGPVQGGTLGAGQVIPASATIALTGVNTSGWNTALWEIYDYPPGWTAPSGWSTAATGVVYYNGTSVSPNPPAWTAPSVAGWGKWGIRLTVNNNTDPTGAINYPRMQDTSMALSMLSVNNLRDGMANEQGQFATALPNEQWVQDYKTNIRTIDAEISAAGGASQSTVALSNGLNSNVAIASGVSSIRFSGYTAAVSLGGMNITPTPKAGVPFDVQFVVPGYQVTIKNNDPAATGPGTIPIITGTGGDLSLPVGGAPSPRFVLDGTLGKYVLQHTGVIQSPTVNVRNFGATGLGTGAPDDAFIQAAIDALGSTGGVVEFPVPPGGTYGIANELKIPASGIELRGLGPTYGNAVSLTATAVMRSIVNNAGPNNRIKDMWLKCANKASHGVYRNGDSTTEYDNVVVWNATIDGFHAAQNADTTTVSAVTQGGTGGSPAATVAIYPGTTPVNAGSGSGTALITIANGALLSSGTVTATVAYNGGSGSAAYTIPADGKFQFANGEIASGILWTFAAGTYHTGTTYEITVTLVHNVNDQACFRNCTMNQCGTIYGSNTVIDMLGAAQYGLGGFAFQLASPHLNGTCATTASNAAIVGTGTNFLTSGARPGDFIRFGFPTWAPTTVHSLNDLITPGFAYGPPGYGYAWQATSIGSAPHETGASAPTWPTQNPSLPGSNPIGQTVTDGNITWTCVDVAAYQIVSVQDNTHIFVGGGALPQASLSSLDYAICVGHGSYDEVQSDASLCRWEGGTAENCAGAGVHIVAAFGDHVSGTQGTQCGVAAFSIGVYGALGYTSVLTKPYSEANFVADYFLAAAYGITLDQPTWGDDNGAVFNPGNVSWGIIHGSLGASPLVAQPIGLNAFSTIPTTGSPDGRSFTVGGPLVITPSTQYVAAASTITVGTSELIYLAMASGSPTVMTSTPTIAAGVEGQTITLVNQSVVSCTFQNAQAAGTNLFLESQRVTLGYGESIQLQCRGGSWFQILKPNQVTYGTNITGASDAPVVAGANNNLFLYRVEQAEIPVNLVSGAFSITGINNTINSGSVGGSEGQSLRLVNYCLQQMTIAHLSGSSTAGNQIICPNAVNLVLAAPPSGGMVYVDLVYSMLANGGSGAWLVTDYSGSNGQQVASNSATQALASTSPVTLTAAQYAEPVIVLTGTLTAGVTVVFPNQPGLWYVDCSGLTTTGQTLTFQSGSTTRVAATVTAADDLYIVLTRGGNTIAVSS